MGPLNAAMKARMLAAQRTDDPTTPSPPFAITWTTLSEYLWELERRGVSANVASFIGAATIREHVIGLENRPATPAELSAMRALVEREMAAGALGIGSALIYAPGAYASTEELIELCRVAARAGGRYISHIRSEGRRLLEAIDELVHISREAGIPAEVYHLKAAGRENWPKMDAALARIEQARRAGLAITADMYLYEAGATGLDATIPPSAFDGGLDALLARLAEPAQRGAIALAMRTPSDAWENLYRAAGSPDRVLLVGFRSEGLRPLIGRTLGAIAERARPRPGGHDSRSRRRGSGQSERGVFPDVREQHPQAARPPMGVHRIRRGGDRARGRVPAKRRPPARLRELRPAAREVRP